MPPIPTDFTLSDTPADATDFLVFCPYDRPASPVVTIDGQPRRLVVPPSTIFAVPRTPDTESLFMQGGSGWWRGVTRDLLALGDHPAFPAFVAGWTSTVGLTALWLNFEKHPANETHGAAVRARLTQLATDPALTVTGADLEARNANERAAVALLALCAGES